MKVEIEELKQFLRDAAKNPPRPAIVRTAKAAVAAASEEIEAMLNKGFTPKQVAEVLRGAGVRISLASLETYLRPTPPKVLPAPVEIVAYEALELDESGHGAQ